MGGNSASPRDHRKKAEPHLKVAVVQGKSSYPKRQTAKERMANAFNELMKRTGLMFDPFGQKRSTYSLRHTSLMFRMLPGENVNLLVLAKNAGTSVGQLERQFMRIWSKLIGKRFKKGNKIS